MGRCDLDARQREQEKLAAEAKRLNTPLPIPTRKLPADEIEKTYPRQT